MKVLLVHPEDDLPRASGGWDLVVDLGRAPVSTYQPWRTDAGCNAISLYDFADGINDLRGIASLLRIGAGVLVDEFGIDWWDLLSPYVVPQLHPLLLIHRLAKYINKDCNLYATRADYRVKALHALLGGTLSISDSALHLRLRKVEHYRHVISKFSARQILQIAQDKFDADHRIRRYFAGKPEVLTGTYILAPSAYINVSRSIISQARAVPDEQFLLVCVREDAKVSELPPNVRMISLNPYFSEANAVEIKVLRGTWLSLKTSLIANAREFEAAAHSGSLDVIDTMFRSWITIRNAWVALLRSQHISSCLCADQNNPSTRIPLLLGRFFGYSSVACHHGALDASMATKIQHPDIYLAKGEMEYDYMTRVCGLSPEKIITATPYGSVARTDAKVAPGKSLVFFTEPYALGDWRAEDIYREMLPHLVLLAEKCGLKLVFKLHPFETRKSHQAFLRRHLPIDTVRQIEVITGPVSERLWTDIRFAITAQSTVAVECAARGIPIFLCGWLGESFVGYFQQFEKFGAGYILESAAQLADIPQIAASRFAQFRAKTGLMNQISPEVFQPSACRRMQVPASAALLV